MEEAPTDEAATTHSIVSVSCGQIKDRISCSDKFIYPVKCGIECQYEYQYDVMVFYFPEIICNLYITCMTGLGILKCK